MRRNEYPYITIFMYAAIIFIVFNHTVIKHSLDTTHFYLSTMITENSILTIFLMMVGFFYLPKYQKNHNQIGVLLKRTSIFYAFMMGLYFIFVLLVDGINTFHLFHFIISKDIQHLWILPAILIGFSIAYLCKIRYGFKRALYVLLVLYIVGTIGECYYFNYQANIEFHHSPHVFRSFQYLWNTMLLTPLLFGLGGFFNSRVKNTSFRLILLQFISLSIVTLILFYLLGQFQSSAWIWKTFLWVFIRITLLGANYCLFQLLLSKKGVANYRLFYLVITMYVMYPFWIHVIYNIKILSFQVWHIFVLTIILTYVGARIVLFIYAYTRKPIVSYNRVWRELDYHALKNNVDAIQSVIPVGCEIMAVVKANAYGHGLYQIATYLETINIHTFAVATIEEAIQLRKYGIESDILVLGNTEVNHAKWLHKYRIIQTLISEEYAIALNQQGYPIMAHLKINSGMNRLGVDCDYQSVIQLYQLKNIKLQGIFTHLCVSDSLDVDAVKFTEDQIHRFDALVKTLRDNHINVGKVHVQASYGVLNYPELKYDYVRMGIAMYGVLSSSNEKTKITLPLKPVLSLKAKITSIREVEANESVGYGRSFIAKQPCRIAMVAIGYADGLPRSLSNGELMVQVRGILTHNVGRICMDQMAIDVSNIENVQVNDIVIIFNHQLRVEEIAAKCNTISNEILSRLGSRIED